jgi:hypothetical protein
VWRAKKKKSVPKRAQNIGFPRDKVQALHHGLEKGGVPHAFGGALALAYYTKPRETVDIDVNVFVPTDCWSEVREALAPLGIEVEVDEGELEREGQVKLEWNENPVHLFFSCDRLHKEMERRVRIVPFAGGTIPLVAPEHLVIRKTILNRRKDRRDIEQILASTPIDMDEVEDWVKRLSLD